MESDFGVPRELSELQKKRAEYHPELPPCLQVSLRPLLLLLRPVFFLPFLEGVDDVSFRFFFPRESARCLLDGGLCPFRLWGIERVLQDKIIKGLNSLWSLSPLFFSGSSAVIIGVN